MVVVDMEMFSEPDTAATEMLGLGELDVKAEMLIVES